METQQKEKNDIQKILLAGLDEAGKTSLLLALKREFSKIGIIKPTKMVNRQQLEFIGTKINLWDLGGQSSYRIEYLKKPDFYFYGTKILIYIIDVQNQSRAKESISYLNDLIQGFKQLKIFPSLFIFFHKYDPTLDATSLKDLIEKIESDIKNKVKYNTNNFYSTSIYDLSSLISAMSEILLNLYLKADIVNEVIKNFAKKIDADAAHVIDQNSLIIGSYYKNEKAKDLLVKSTPHFLNLNDFFSNIDTPENISEDQINIQKFGKYFLFKNLLLEKGKRPYYILMYKEDPDYNSDEYNALVKLLNNILY